MADLLTEKMGELSISNNGRRLKENEVAALIDSLTKKTGEGSTVKLTTIDLNSASLNNSGAEGLGKLLQGTACTISVLNLSCNNLWNDGFSHIATALNATSVCSVRELTLSHNHLENAGAKSVAGLLIGNNTITTLTLDQNAISDEGCEALCAALSENNSLTTLSLQANHIGECGARALANMLGGLGLYVDGKEPEPEPEPEEPVTGKSGKGKKPGKAEQKTEEQLEKERIEKEEKDKIKKIAEERRAVSLRRNKSLVNLIITNNDITVEGLNAIADGAKKHPELLRLDADRLDEQLFPGAAKAGEAVDGAVFANQRKRVAIVQSAFFMGLHERVGCRSSIRCLLQGDSKSIEPSVMANIWDFLGPV